MYTVENVEKLTEIFNKINLIGICTHEKNFQTEFIIYLQTKKKKIQLQSFVPFPDDMKLTYKEVNNFTLPYSDETSKYFVPRLESEIAFKIDSAKNLEYSYSDAAKLANDQILFSQHFSIGLESSMKLIINDAMIEECKIDDLITDVL